MTKTQDLPVLLRGPHGNRLLLALGQRERSTLGALLASGKIGSAEMLAANRWYEVFAMAEHGAFDTEKAGCGGSVKLFAQERQMAAVTSHRLAREALGKAGDERMRAVLSDGLSIKGAAVKLAASMPARADGKACKVDPMFMCGLIVGDLARLVEHYTTIDGARKHRR